MIDWKRVKELQNEIGKDDFSEVLHLFLEEVEGGLMQLQQKSSEEIQVADLHFLKGSALNLGFADFARLCAQGETAVGAGLQHTVDKAMLLATFQTSRDQFFTKFEPT
jgi:HPt (histidine-containing phosphotransfer) domain-containing protein